MLSYHLDPFVFLWIISFPVFSLHAYILPTLVHRAKHDEICLSEQRQTYTFSVVLVPQSRFRLNWMTLSPEELFGKWGKIIILSIAQPSFLAPLWAFWIQQTLAMSGFSGPLRGMETNFGFWIKAEWLPHFLTYSNITVPVQFPSIQSKTWIPQQSLKGILIPNAHHI